MITFAYRLKPSRLGMLRDQPTPHEADVVTAHFEHLQRLNARGIVRMAGRTLTADEDTFGLVVFVAASEDEARGLMNADPAVEHGVMHAQLFPFRLALWSNDEGVPPPAV